MKIDGREIGNGQSPYVVAEIGANHGGSLERALELISAAKDVGADSVKFQCYEASTITLDSDRPEFTIKDGPWKGRRLYDLYAETQTPFAWFPALFEHARKVGITCFASVFDRSSVDMLEKIGCPAYKIASFELVDLSLIRYAAATGKPLILSTGMARTEDVWEAGKAIREASGTQEYETMNAIPLHCVSGYPTPIGESNLHRLIGFHGGIYGISDHTTGIEIPIAATALGACLIEKHFKLQGFPKTQDSEFSLGEGAFRKMIRSVRDVWNAMQPRDADSEASSRPLRRSLFAVQDIAEGELFTHENVRSIRPGDGLPPKEIDSIVGKAASRDIGRGEPMTREMIR